MNTNELLVRYLNRQYVDDESIAKVTNDNALYFSTAHLFGIDIEEKSSYNKNKLRYDLLLESLAEIQNLFSVSNISFLLFKGVVLANRLYDKPQKRYVGDIDVFVDKKDFPAALTLLIRLGYSFWDEKSLYNEHHIVLVRDGVIIELHRKIFNPVLEINETYLLKNTVSFSFSKYVIQTFDITATLLHLIYHLYVDTYWSHSLHSVLNSAKAPKTKRFLYRAYEIALFSEKYGDEIKWAHIVNDLKHQKLRVFFKKMIQDIIAIFPNAFPDSYLQVVNNKAYIDDEHDIWCKRLLESTGVHEDLGFILSGFIDDYWNKRSIENVHIKAGERFILNNLFIKDDEEDNYKLTCEVFTEKSDSDLKLTFKITNDDFCFTKIDDYDTTASDGIHLMLFGTEKYSYNSIYIFPKIINGEVKAIPVDVKHSERLVMDASLVDTTCKYANGNYTVTVMLKNKFLRDNHLNKYFYMGLIVVDCSTKTKKRKAELILSDIYDEWYNPTYYAKIEID